MKAYWNSHMYKWLFKKDTESIFSTHFLTTWVGMKFLDISKKATTRKIHVSLLSRFVKYKSLPESESSIFKYIFPSKFHRLFVNIFQTNNGHVSVKIEQNESVCRGEKSTKETLYAFQNKVTFPFWRLEKVFLKKYINSSKTKCLLVYKNF